MKTIQILAMIALASVFSAPALAQQEPIPFPFDLAVYLHRSFKDLDKLCLDKGGFELKDEVDKRYLCSEFNHMDKLLAGTIVATRRDAVSVEMVDMIVVSFPINTRLKAAAMSKAWVEQACSKAGTMRGNDEVGDFEIYSCGDKNVIMTQSSSQFVITFTKQFIK